MKLKQDGLGELGRGGGVHRQKGFQNMFLLIGLLNNANFKHHGSEVNTLVKLRVVQKPLL